MEKIESTSMNLEEKNIEKLKELFPNCVTEGKIDFDVLREMLGDEVDNNREKYQFTWNGKAQAIKIAQTPSTATLRPCKEKSKDWDTTENLYIEGDNLEVLKQLQKTYFGKIKMIYIDPPYNTGGDFVYKDDFKNSIENYKQQTQQTTKSNPETSGRYHTDWLNMMYPRLILARNLLSNNGLIFISIDDNEHDNLKKICDDIFGEKNYVSSFTWIKTMNPPSLGSKIRDNMEYIVCYAKRISDVQKLYGRESNQKDSPLANAGNGIQEIIIPKHSCEFPNFKEGLICKGKKESGIDLIDDIEVLDFFNENDFRIVFNSKWGQSNVYEEVKNGTHFVIKDKDYFSIRYIKGNIDYVVPDKYLDYTKFDVKDNEYGRKELEKLLGKAHFDYPKNTPLLKTLILMNTNLTKNDIVLDFFSGSGTTADAIMQLNAIDSNNRKFIMIQLPELMEDETYKDICEVGEDRIRKAGEQLKAEWIKDHKGDGLFANESIEFPVDIGFKVFKLDTSNIRAWNNVDVLDEDALGLYNKTFESGRSNEDILYEIMLKYGFFDMKASEVGVNGKQMYKVGSRFMLVCLEDNITVDDIKAICKEKPRYVVFKEEGFANDNDKINAEYNLKKAGVEEVKCI